MRSSPASGRSMGEVFAETERLRLRDWRDEDELAFYQAMNTPAVMQHLGGVQTPEEFRAAYHRIRGFERDFGHTFWIVEDNASGAILGFCGLKRVNSPGAGDLTGQHEIGWRPSPIRRSPATSCSGTPRPKRSSWQPPRALRAAKAGSRRSRRFPPRRPRAPRRPGR